MTRENIILHKGEECTFTQENIGKYKVVAHIPGSDYTIKENVFADKTVEVILPTSDENIEISNSNASSRFLLGTDINYLSLLYRYNENHGYTADELNKAAITYIKDWNNIASDNEKIDISDNPSEQPTYFGIDGNGIYSIIEKDASFEDRYHNSIIVNINGNEYIKAYVKGTCEIVDVDYSGENDFNMISSIAYPFTFKYSEDENDNTVITYLFINSKIELLYSVDNKNKIFKKKNLDSGKIYSYNYVVPDRNDYLFINRPIYIVNRTSPYILKTATNPNNGSYKISTTNLVSTSMMINGGTVRQIIIPETIKTIAHFYGGSNANTIILPNSLIEIGECAFYGSSLNGEVKFRNIFESKISSIGNYAFSHTNNLKIFPYNLNNTEERENIKHYLISKCGYKESVIEDIFENRIDKQIYTVIPNIYILKNNAFDNAGSGSSIKNIVISKINYIEEKSFANNTFNNIVIPKDEIFSPGYKEATICYIPSQAISLYYKNGIDGKTNPFFITNSVLTYNEYTSVFDNYGVYKTEANSYLTFENTAGNPRWYIIEDEVYTGPTSLSEE